MFSFCFGPTQGCFYVLSVICFQVLCMLLKIWIELNIFASAYPVVLALFIETAILFPLDWLCTFVKSWLRV